MNSNTKAKVKSHMYSRARWIKLSIISFSRLKGSMLMSLMSTAADGFWRWQFVRAASVSVLLQRIISDWSLRTSGGVSALLSASSTCVQSRFLHISSLWGLSLWARHSWRLFFSVEPCWDCRAFLWGARMSLKNSLHCGSQIRAKQEHQAHLRTRQTRLAGS